MTTALVIATLVVAVLTLCVALVELKILRGRFRRGDEAELRAETVRFNENDRVPSGWQVFATVRNMGGAIAYNPDISWGRPDANEVRQRATGRNELVQPGQSTTLGRDLATIPDGTQKVWLTWSDARGVQMHDTGQSFRAPSL